MVKTTAINLNDTGTVRVTARGVLAMQEYYAGLGCSHILARNYPNLAPGSVVSSQLWDLFQIFGPSMSMVDSPLETNMQVIGIGD